MYEWMLINDCTFLLLVFTNTGKVYESALINHHSVYVQSCMYLSCMYLNCMYINCMYLNEYQKGSTHLTQSMFVWATKVLNFCYEWRFPFCFQAINLFYALYYILEKVMLIWANGWKRLSESKLELFDCFILSVVVVSHSELGSLSIAVTKCSDIWPLLGEEGLRKGVASCEWLLEYWALYP